MDFEDRDTHECLFKEYWEIVKEEEGLSRSDLVAVNGNKRQMKSSTPTSVAKTLQMNRYSNSKSKSKNNTYKFTTWGSKPLIEFLTNIGVDTTKELSQYDVRSIIFKYVQEKDLIHPIKKKKIICDRNLYLIFKKNTIAMKHIDLLLRPHFSPNDDDDENNNHQRTSNGNKRCSVESVQQTEDVAVVNKQHKTVMGCSEEKSPEEKACFASVVAHNIKQVYLRRSLVEDLLKQPASFEDKVVGSFVKVMKTDSRELHSKVKISQQLLPVTG